MTDDTAKPDNTSKSVWQYDESIDIPINIFRVINTPDEVIIGFGLHGASDDNRVNVKAQAMMSVACAKRLHQVLGAVLNQYESIYGTVETDAKKRIAARQAVSKIMSETPNLETQQDE